MKKEFKYCDIVLSAENGKLFVIIILFFSIQRLVAQTGCYPTDVFGISQFYTTKPGTREWTSAHWNNGVDRTIKYSSDPYDPTDWTEDHSESTNGFHIDGKGIMNMSGGSPRFHINSTRSTKVPVQLFLNSEFTAYYRRIGTSGAAYGGMIVGARSSPLGHASSGDDCDATTYYCRFRHDGKWDFEKELKHPASDYWSGSGFHTQDPLWNNKILPQNQWIGMKYIIYNIENNTKVKMEVYIDSVSNGNPINGGTWIKVGEVIDQGNWPVQSSAITGCSYADPKTIILEGHGTFLLRTDGDQAEYKMVSIHEIDINSLPPVDRLNVHDNKEKIKACIGIEAKAIYKAKTDYLMVVDTEDQVSTLRSDLAEIAKLDARSLIVTAPGNRVDFVSRFFAPQSGIDEDPVTGSAYTSLIPLWLELFGKKKMKTSELSKRGESLVCINNGDRCLIGGKAQLCLTGEINIP